MPVYKLRIEELDQKFVKELKAKFGDAKIEIRVFPSESQKPPLSENDFWHIMV